LVKVDHRRCDRLDAVCGDLRNRFLNVASVSPVRLFGDVRPDKAVLACGMLTGVAAVKLEDL
jgi:hypothetical protein